jgi:signal peptidase I
VKAGRKGWEGLVPIYNMYVWQKVTERPWWWILILIVPGVQFLMLIIMHVQMARSFGQRGALNTLLAVVAPFYMLPKMAFSKDIKYTGNIDWANQPKNSAHEWSDALLFALIAAFIIRTFVMEAFTIPTPSMERSMLVGDFLFVSKARYGAKLPETPLSFPLAHHTLPVIGTKSYLDWQKLDYHRLPGWADVERGDPVVFNFPEGDTVLVERPEISYYSYLRDQGLYISGNVNTFEKNPQRSMDVVRKGLIAGTDKQYSLTVRPKDKKENYVKRCVAIPKDVFELKDRKMYINGELQDQYNNLQFNYVVYTKDNKEVGLAVKMQLKEKIDLSIENWPKDVTGRPSSKPPFMITMTDKQYEAMKGLSFVERIDVLNDTVAREPGIGQYGASYRPVFPHSKDYPWTRDNFGPMTVPAAGASVDLTVTNLCLYERIIRDYEENELYVKGGKIYINGEEASSYTFKLNYYWMMGDNRHNSLDSRYWGFVPEDHVVGRPSFTWLSLDQELGWFDGKIRWSRMFKGVD